MLFRLLPIFLILNAALGCHRLTNTVDHDIIACGQEAKDTAADQRFIKIQGLASGENVSAAYVSADGRQQSLNLTSSGCVMLSQPLEESGWLVVRSHQGGEYLNVHPMEELNSLSEISLQKFEAIAHEWNCPTSPGSDTWYGRSEKVLPLIDAVRPALYYRSSLYAEPGPLMVKQSSVLSALQASLVGINSGSYRLELTEYDFSRIPASIEKSRKNCQLKIDEQAPQASRSETTLPRSVQRNSLIDLIAQDETPIRVRFCWQEGYAEEATCDMQDRNTNVTTVPKAGNWLLSYQFEDAAGNRSKRYVEKYSTENVFDSIRGHTERFDKAVKESDRLSALVHLLRAVKKKNQFQSTVDLIERGQDLLHKFLRLALGSIPQYKFKISSYRNPYSPIADGYLLEESKADGEGSLVKYSNAHERLGALPLKNVQYQYVTREYIITMLHDDTILYYDHELNLVDTIKPPAGWNATFRFDAQYRRILYFNNDSPVSKTVFIYDREGERAWKKTGVTWRDLSQDGFEFVGDGSLILTSIEETNTSYLFSSSQPETPVMEWADQFIVQGRFWNVRFWKDRSCVQFEGILRCFNNADPKADLLTLDVDSSSRIEPQSSETDRFLPATRFGRTRIIDMENLEAEWEDYTPRTLSMTALQPDRSMLLMQLDSGTIVGAEQPGGEWQSIYYVTHNFNNSQRKPWLVHTSMDCNMAFYTYEDQDLGEDRLIAVGVEDGHFQPYQSFKVKSPDAVTCRRVDGQRQISVRSEHESDDAAAIYIFNEQNNLFVKTPRVDDSKQLGCEEKDCNTIVDRTFADRRLTIVDGELYLAEGNGPSKRLNTSGSFVSGLFANASTFIAEDSEGARHAIDLSNGRSRPLALEAKGDYVQLLPLQNGAYLAVADPDAEARLWIYRTSDFAKVVDLSLDKLKGSLSLAAGPNDQLLFLIIDRSKAYFAAIDSLLQGTAKPQFFATLPDLTGAGSDPLSHRMFVQSAERLILGDENGIITQDLTWKESLTFTQIPQAAGLWGHQEGAAVTLVAADGSSVIPEILSRDIEHISVIGEQLLAHGDRFVYSLPLDEAQLVKRSCEYLRDYLLHAPQLSAAEKEVCGPLQKAKPSLPFAGWFR